MQTSNDVDIRSLSELCLSSDNFLYDAGEFNPVQDKYMAMTFDYRDERILMKI